MALLDTLRAELSEREMPLHLVLGLISLARRLDATLPQPAEPNAATAPPAAPPPPAPPPAPQQADQQAAGGDRFLYLLLGLVSLRRTLLSELERLRAGQKAPPAPPGAGATAPPLLHDLLR